nr:tetratricopeptide repeat protein [Thiocapsa sp. KS1]
MSLGNLGNLARAAGDGAGARGYFAESLEIRRALVAQEPGRADLRVDLAITYWNQYLLAVRQDERHWLDQVLETLRPLREGGLVHGQLDQLWGLASETLRSSAAAD